MKNVIEVDHRGARKKEQETIRVAPAALFIVAKQR